MTYLVPVIAGVGAYVSMSVTGHPTAAPFVAAGGVLLGWVGRFAGHGVHLTGGQMRKVEHLMHRTIAANWGIRPLTQYFDEAEQQKLIGSIFDAVAGEPIQDLVEQWPIIWAHVQRVHFSGIPPLKSLRAMKRAYRAGIFSKDKHKARELAKPVADAYAMLHPDPDSDREWYLRWTASIGLSDEVAHQVWAESRLSTPRATSPSGEEAPVAQRQSEQSGGYLSDEEIERRLAASR